MRYAVASVVALVAGASASYAPSSSSEHYNVYYTSSSSDGAYYGYTTSTAEAYPYGYTTSTAEAYPYGYSSSSADPYAYGYDSSSSSCTEESSSTVEYGYGYTTSTPVVYGYGYSSSSSEDCETSTSSYPYDYVYTSSTSTECPYTTEVVTAYETWCPEPTTIVYNECTYTVTEAQTLTLTNGPYTVTRPIYTSVVTECPTTTAAPPAVYTAVYTPVAEPAAPYTPQNATSTAYAYSTGVYTYEGPSSNSGTKVAFSGAAFAAVFGLAALLL